MNSSLVFNIFPVGSLSLSVVTTVWIGVWVVVFFNLRLGWVLSGLVVPGYLVPLILVKPWSAAVVVVEGAITYLFVWLYSEKLSRATGFANFFGRDRFFALLLVSVIVRVCFDVLLWPALGEYLNSTFGLNFDYRNNLHSFGLIVVALIANQLWKPGLRKGFVVLGVTVFITFLAVRYLLMPFTNFSVGSLAYMYENLAASMLAGPKAYIVLLTTAFIASHFNLRYGWEYSGILIPALLALEWYQPFKLLITFTETFIILIVAGQLLKLKIFQRTTIEGARKVLFFFNISFFYKLLLGHVIVTFFPRYLVSDFYGFGYLLSTLLAVKMHDKEIAAKITRASLQTSLVSLVIATCIGFSLTYLPNVLSSANTASTVAGTPELQHEERSLTEIIREEQVLIYKSIRRNSVPIPLPEEIDIFGEALRLLQKWQVTQKASQLGEAQQLFNRLRYSISLVEQHYLVLREQDPKRGWGMFILHLQPDNQLQVQVPAPITEWGTSYAGFALFKTFNGASLAISGCRRTANDDGSADVLNNSRTLFYVFQKTFGKHEVIQVRGLTGRYSTLIYDQKYQDTTQDMPAGSSMLMIASSLPEGINLKLLGENIGEFNVRWKEAPMTNSLRQSSSGSFAELFLTRADRRELLFKPFFAVDELTTETSVQSIVGYLQDWILTRKGYLAEKGSETYRKPTLEEFLFWDMELLTPLTRLIDKQQTRLQWSDEELEELRVLKNSAAIFHYDLKHYRHQTTGQEYLILTEQENSPDRKYWGTYIFRLGKSSRYVIQVPRPLSERNVFEYAVSLFENLDARALLISGAHPLANSDGSADVIRFENKENFFNLVNQTLLREAALEPMLVIQCRAFANSDNLDTPDALIASYTGLSLNPEKSPMVDRVIDILQNRYLFSVKFITGEANEAGYEVGGIPQALYLEQTANKEFINLWLSPTLRAAFRQQTENRPLENHFTTMKIETVEKELFSYLQDDTGRSTTDSAFIDLTQLQESIADYIHSQDILALQQMLVSYPEIDFRQVIDVNSKQAFLVALNSSKQPLLVANLHPLQEDRSFPLKPQLDRDTVSAYIDSRSLWLLPGN